MVALVCTKFATPFRRVVLVSLATRSLAYSFGGRRALVTGGRGVLGGEICSRLASEGVHVTAIVRPETHEAPPGAAERIASVPVVPSMVFAKPSVSMTAVFTSGDVASSSAVLHSASDALRSTLAADGTADAPNANMLALT